MKIVWNAVGKYTPEEGTAHARYSQSLGLPMLGSAEAKGVPLAVVGGGPSIIGRQGELMAWPGDVWAVNGAYRWCRERGIDATLFSCDPSLENVHGCERAIIAQTCPPEIYDALASADVRLHRIGPGEHGTGPTSATGALKAALLDGYVEVTFFGCEGSFNPSYSHAYDIDDFDEPSPWRLEVSCNGGTYLSEAEYVMQSEYLSAAIRTWPGIYHERSGGLLRAMVANQEYDVTRVSRELRAILSPLDNLAAVGG